ncbi:MAG: DUF3800 domain-containing protein [Kiritimatiellae bacterium]|nr:DUF3800 domain-containing protein [Kiritimatiellia bacterium]
MFMCYVDESGDTGLFDANERNSQPVFLLCALIVNQSHLESITREVIRLKQKHFPSYSQGAQHWHDWLKVEVKGANIRRALREETHKSRRHILGFLSEVVSLLESHDARISARVYIKTPSAEFKGASVYSAAMQRLAQTFEDKLMRENDKGVIVLDSRNKVKNVPVAHSLFTWNLSAHGTAYRYMAELPLFGHSDNHALLQLVDWVASGILSPMATSAFCGQYSATCIHASHDYDIIRETFGQRIKSLQYRYERDGHKLGGIHVLGGNCRLNPLLIFGDKV